MVRMSLSLLSHRHRLAAKLMYMHSAKEFSVAEVLINIRIEPLAEGGYLATGKTLQGLIGHGRTPAETIEIAQDAAGKLIFL